MIEPEDEGRREELLRLTSMLTDVVLDAKMTARAVPAVQAQALSQAADLLQEYKMPWPPLLSQALHHILNEEEAASAVEPAAKALRVDFQRLSGFVDVLRRKRGQL